MSSTGSKVARAHVDSRTPSNSGDDDLRHAISEVLGVVKDRLGDSAKAEELDQLIKQLANPPK